MSYLAVGMSLALIAWVLVDAFEAMLLPRRIAPTSSGSPACSTSTRGHRGLLWRGACGRASGAAPSSVSSVRCLSWLSWPRGRSC